ncbi:hypothetical protein CTRI78_v008839 [Colletotrichum trifolii]|uniref:Uncharacterized protein n=1 Tax=Colletotrichum trifolii TaxID=5466 RepID=A0A4R8QXT6_COLTR|nr:hypothetical protein CTRI78_v008839 [Colletotrichum trifolii]
MKLIHTTLALMALAGTPLAASADSANSGDVPFPVPLPTHPPGPPESSTTAPAPPSTTSSRPRIGLPLPTEPFTFHTTITGIRRRPRPTGRPCLKSPRISNIPLPSAWFCPPQPTAEPTPQPTTETAAETITQPTAQPTPRPTRRPFRPRPIFKPAPTYPPWSPSPVIPMPGIPTPGIPSPEDLVTLDVERPILKELEGPFLTPVPHLPFPWERLLEAANITAAFDPANLDGPPVREEWIDAMLERVAGLDPENLDERYLAFYSALGIVEPASVMRFWDDVKDAVERIWQWRVNGCAVTQCISESAAFLGSCASARGQFFANPFADVACIWDVANLVVNPDGACRECWKIIRFGDPKRGEDGEKTPCDGDKLACE